MQQDAEFITADFLYMFRASYTHHQEYKIVTRQPPVQVVMVAGESSLRHIRDETKVSFSALSVTISKVKGKNLGATHNFFVISQSVMAEITHAGVEWTFCYCGETGIRLMLDTYDNNELLEW
jgi:hypothetical protein